MSTISLNLKPGDEVMARDEKTGKVIAKRILSHFATLHEDDVRALTIKNSSGEEQLIITSDEHPFYVQDQGWFNASKLSAGDMLKTLNGGAVTLLANSHMNGTETLHNLEVEEFHTFGIEGNGVWVHNACDIRVAKRPGSFRKKTVKDDWDNAAHGTKPDTKACPTCTNDVSGNPHNGEKRNGADGWDVDHQPKWKNRDLSGMDRKQVLDEFNKETRLRCQSCNRADNQ